MSCCCYLSIYTSLSIHLCLFLCRLCVCLSVFSTCLSVCLFVCFPCLFVFLSVHLHASLLRYNTRIQKCIHNTHKHTRTHTHTHTLTHSLTHSLTHCIAYRLLRLNPAQRWSPEQARLHPLVTGEQWLGDWTPPRDVAADVDRRQTDRQTEPSMDSAPSSPRTPSQFAMDDSPAPSPRQQAPAAGPGPAAKAASSQGGTAVAAAGLPSGVGASPMSSPRLHRSSQGKPMARKGAGGASIAHSGGDETDSTSEDPSPSSGPGGGVMAISASSLPRRLQARTLQASLHPVLGASPHSTGFLGPPK